jgi:hypothetical protein
LVIRSSSSLRPSKKNIKTRVNKPSVNSSPLFSTFLCQSFRILFVAVHLFFLRGSFVSSVATTLSTQTLCKVASHLFTGCPPLLIVWLACYRTKLRVCHAFCTPLQNSLHFIYATFVRKLPSAATFRLVNFLQHTNRALHSTGKPNELQSTVS